VIVAVHGHENANLIVILPGGEGNVDGCGFIDEARSSMGPDHAHGVVPVHVHDGDHGADHDHVKGHEHEARLTNREPQVVPLFGRGSLPRQPVIFIAPRY
jgi:hypothetical protein